MPMDRDSARNKLETLLTDFKESHGDRFPYISEESLVIDYEIVKVIECAKRYLSTWDINEIFNKVANGDT
jgi:hypothetical protein